MMGSRGVAVTWLVVDTHLEASINTGEYGTIQRDEKVTYLRQRRICFTCALKIMDSS